jgi:hypothetical protein
VLDFEEGEWKHGETHLPELRFLLKATIPSQQVI